MKQAFFSSCQLMGHCFWKIYRWDGKYLTPIKEIKVLDKLSAIHEAAKLGLEITPYDRFTARRDFAQRIRAKRARVISFRT